jgi:hypothetical protein
MAYQKLQVGRAASVTASDSADIAAVTGGTNNGCVLYVGSFGDVKVRTIGGDDVTFKNVQAGTFLPVQVIRVFSTGTTSTDIVALW